MRSILVDTGFWLALNNNNDKHHKKALNWLIDKQNVDYRFATTWIVMCESFFLIKNLVNYNKAVELFVSYSQSEFDIYGLGKDDSMRVLELMNKYKDLDIDLADISLVILAEELNTGAILTVDAKDFDALRWNKNKVFKQLLR